MSTVTDTSETLSGEAVALDVQPVGFFLRTLGALIDVLLSVGVVIMGLLLLFWLAARGGLDDPTQRILTIAILVFALVVLPCGLEVALRGRSLGKLLVGGRIVRLDGGTTGFRHAFIRAFVGVLEIYLTAGAVALLAGAFSQRSQRLGDMVAGTYSQSVRMPQPIPLVPIMPPALLSWAPLADVARLPDRLARRITQFLQNADRMTPHARAHIAQQLVDEVHEYVSPPPPAPPEQTLIAMTILRREREHRALRLADERVERLLGRQQANTQLPPLA